MEAKFCSPQNISEVLQQNGGDNRKKNGSMQLVQCNPSPQQPWDWFEKTLFTPSVPAKRVSSHGVHPHTFSLVAVVRNSAQKST